MPAASRKPRTKKEAPPPDETTGGEPAPLPASPPLQDIWRTLTVEHKRQILYEIATEATFPPRDRMAAIKMDNDMCEDERAAREAEEEAGNVAAAGGTPGLRPDHIVVLLDGLTASANPVSRVRVRDRGREQRKDEDQDEGSSEADV